MENRKTNKRPRSLHGTITLALLVGALVSLLGYVVFTYTVIEELEESVMTTLVGHEIEEIVTSMEEDPTVGLAHSATVNAYLLSREHRVPIPDYLRELSPLCTPGDSSRRSRNSWDFVDKIWMSNSTSNPTGGASTSNSPSEMAIPMPPVKRGLSGRGGI